MYLKLFFGMGFIWIFEIIGGLVSDSIDEASWSVGVDCGPVAQWQNI
jgi:hypothetical protein